MNTLEAIEKRRSCRSFKPDALSRAQIEDILRAGILAPSGKNAQPWEFIVLEESARTRLSEMMLSGVEAVKAQGIHPGSAENSARIIGEAPVTVLVYNPLRKPEDARGHDRYWLLVHTQSVGAAIQNMLLRAEEIGLGSLWICDVWVAEPGLSEWLQREDELVAAVTFGYPAEAPPARPRKPVEKITTWYR